MNWYLKVLKNYANFNGRARRKEYWMFFLFQMIIIYGLMILSVVLETGILAIIANIYSLATLLPGIAVAVRRAQDVGKDWYFMLIPIYNFILAVTEGDKGDNEFGSDPKLEADPIS
ncbi:DUF805 domain-containing protein [Aquimarina addita]